jgi:hypothetical protein
LPFFYRLAAKFGSIVEPKASKGNIQLEEMPLSF